MKFKIYRTSGRAIKHPDCTYIPSLDRSRLSYEINIDTLEELVEFNEWIWNNVTDYTLGTTLLLKSNTELEVYDTYRE